MNKPETLCMAPWVHTYIGPDNRRNLCCVSNINFDENQELKDAWNSNKIKNIRKKMLDGEEIEECYRCDPDAEHSYRKYWNYKFSDKIGDVISKTNEDGEFNGLPISVDYRTNICNFKCKTCNEIFSSSIHQEYHKLGLISDDHAEYHSNILANNGRIIKNEIDLLTSSIDIDLADDNEDPEKVRERANLEKDLRKLKAVQRKSNNPKVALYYKKINKLRSIKKVLDDKVQAQNEMVKALEMILTSPYGFYSLTKPNSSANLESFSKEIGKRTGRENKIAKNSEMTNYLSTFKIDNALQEGKAALSAWATNTTFSQNLIAANLKRTDLFRINAYGVRTYVNDPLFSREEKERKRANNSGLFSLSDMFMADGKTLVSSSCQG